MTLCIVYSPQALNDLDQIFEFIALDNPRRAISYLEEIQRACEGLIKTPFIGMERPDLRLGLRILPLWRRIIIAYELPSGLVDILRVFSGRQDYEAIIARS